MGVRLPFVFTTTIIASVPASGADTVIATTPPINQPLDGAAILVLGWCPIFAGTGVTALVLRLRRGTTTAGTLVNVNTTTQAVTASTFNNISFSYVDANPGIVAGQQYSISMSATGATGISTVGDVFMAALIL